MRRPQVAYSSLRDYALLEASIRLASLASLSGHRPLLVQSLGPGAEVQAARVSKYLEESRRPCGSQNWPKACQVTHLAHVGARGAGCSMPTRWSHSWDASAPASGQKRGRRGKQFRDGCGSMCSSRIPGGCGHPSQPDVGTRLGLRTIGHLTDLIGCWQHPGFDGTADVC